MSVRNTLPYVVLAFLLLGIPATGGLLWMRSQPVVEAPVLGAPEVRDIVVQTVATGSVVPRDEVALKARVSGVVEELMVEPGDEVEAGALIARIRVIPDSGRLAAARAGVREAGIRLRDALRERDELADLVQKGAASPSDLEGAETRLALAQQTLNAAETDLTIVRDGAARSIGTVATSVRATVSGMVLTIPIEVGDSVIEANTFNEGTTIAEVADMSDLIYVGFVDEAEVGKIREGMALSVALAAWPDTRMKGTLEHISPKGVDVSGAIQFEVRAALNLASADGRFVRANMSANAKVELDRRDQVLAISEAFLIPDRPETAVLVKTGDQWLEQPVELGLSDGIHTEVLSGLSADAVLKRPEG
ncbi:MAG: efflux transporter periplasmic adaptor subunit [Deltaproteobacteria bacterium]|nr:efflux transporter periplasmic adaptor subunit [Deltaproteobacteria bacterium]